MGIVRAKHTDERRAVGMLGPPTQISTSSQIVILFRTKFFKAKVSVTSAFTGTAGSAPGTATILPTST